MARSSRSSNGGADTGDPKTEESAEPTTTTLQAEESAKRVAEYGPERIPGTFDGKTDDRDDPLFWRNQYTKEVLIDFVPAVFHGSDEVIAGFWAECQKLDDPNEQEREMLSEMGDWVVAHPWTAPPAIDSESLQAEESPPSETDGLPPDSEAKPIDVVKLQATMKFGNPEELSDEVVKAFAEGYRKQADAIASYTQGLELAARYFEAVGGTMMAWQEEIYDVRNIVKTPQATNDFQPYVKWAHGDNPDTSGIISRLAYALHVWAEYPDGKRPSPVADDGEGKSAFLVWIDHHGGYYGLYQGREESRGRYVDPGDYTVFKLKIAAAKPSDTRWRVYLTGEEDLGAFEEHFPLEMLEVARVHPGLEGHTPTIGHPATYLSEDAATPLVKAFTDVGCSFAEAEMPASPEPVTPERIRAQAAASGGATTTTSPSPAAPSSPPRRTAAAPTGRGRGRPAGQRSRVGSTPTARGKNTRVLNAIKVLAETDNDKLVEIILGDARPEAIRAAEETLLWFREIADNIEVALDTIDEKKKRAEVRKGGRRKAA